MADISKGSLHFESYSIIFVILCNDVRISGCLDIFFPVCFSLCWCDQSIFTNLSRDGMPATPILVQGNSVQRAALRGGPLPY